MIIHFPLFGYKSVYHELEPAVTTKRRLSPRRQLSKASVTTGQVFPLGQEAVAKFTVVWFLPNYSTRRKSIANDLELRKMTPYTLVLVLDVPIIYVYAILGFAVPFCYEFRRSAPRLHPRLGPKFRLVLNFQTVR